MPARHASERRTLPYDPALDGLRALAVSAVLLYHAGLWWAPGGYLGVDLFFVLSGYLITTLLLLERQSTGGIALGAFWARRARRLLPALVAVVTWALIYGVWIAEESERAGIRRDALGTLFYVANWVSIVHEASYFEQFADSSPLRHTWSLAIEEQWYLLWPVVTVVGLRRWAPGSRAWLAGIGAGAATSAVALVALADVPGDPSRAYFGTDTRAQALLAGALLAFVAQRSRGDRLWRTAAPTGALGLVGFLLLVALADDQATWMYRGGFTLAALTCGAAVIGVATAPANNTLRRALASEPLPLVGRVSYGLYLWHWPVYVLVDADRSGLDGMPLLVARLVVTATVTALSYRLIELPVRHNGHRLSRVVAGTGMATLGAAALAIVVLPGSVGGAEGERVRIEAAPAIAPTAGSTRGSPSPRATPSPSAPAPTPAVGPDDPGAVGQHGPVVGPEDPVRVLLLGDSVYLELATHFERAAHPDVLLSADTRLGCGVITGDTNPNCDDRLEAWAASVEEDRPHVAVVALSKWDLFDKTIDGELVTFASPAHRALVAAELEENVQVLTKHGARVLIVNVPCLDRKGGFRLDGRLVATDPSRAPVLNAMAADYVAGTNADVRIVDLRSHLCPDDVYVADLDGVPLHRDGVHFDPAAFGAVWDWLAERIVSEARSEVSSTGR